MNFQQFEEEERRLTDEIGRQMKTLAEGVRTVPAAQQQGFADEFFRCLMALVKQQKISAHKIAAMAKARKANSPEQTVLARRVVELLNLQRKQSKEMLASLIKVNAALAKARKAS